MPQGSDASQIQKLGIELFLLLQVQSAEDWRETLHLSMFNLAVADPDEVDPFEVRDLLHMLEAVRCTFANCQSMEQPGTD